MNTIPSNNQKVSNGNQNVTIRSRTKRLTAFRKLAIINRKSGIPPTPVAQLDRATDS